MRFVTLLMAFALACEGGDERIPLTPEAGTTTSNVVSTFAVTTVLLGEADLRGVESTSAWRAFGFDLDGKATTSSSTDVCSLHPGAPNVDQVDGLLARDNAFGSVLLPIIESVGSLVRGQPSILQSGLIQSGAWTWLLEVTGLPSDPKQSTDGLRAQLFVGAQLGSAPSFDSTMNWPVLASSLANGVSVAGGARVQFSNVFVTDGTLVATDAAEPLVLPMIVVDGLHPLRIHHPTITLTLASLDSAGVVAGVLDPEDVVAALQNFAGHISRSLCGSAFDAIAEQLRDAQDILDDTSNAPGVPCNAISIGIGITARVIANPTTVAADPPAPDFCAPTADAGLDAASE